MRASRAKWLLLFLIWPFLLPASPLDHWHKRTSGTGLNLYGVAYGSGRFVSVGQWGATLVSSNGLDWVTNSTSITQTLYSVAFGAGNFIAVGDDGAIFSSGSGSEWVPRDSQTAQDLRGVHWVQNRFFATGANGTLLSSSNGLDWAVHDSNSPHTLNAVAFGNETFVAVSSANSNPTSIGLSRDGITWSNHIFNFIQVYDIAFGGGQFIALGVRGKVHISTNGQEWQELFQTVDSRYLFGITYVHGRFVAVGGLYGGGNQKIVSSADGVSWTLHPVNSNHSGTLRAIAYGDSTFVAVGEKGLILQSDSFFRLAPGSTVQNGARSWLFTPDEGRAYRFQFSPTPSGPNWIDITNFTGHGEPMSLVDPSAQEASSRFYRVVSP